VTQGFRDLATRAGGVEEHMREPDELVLVLEPARLLRELVLVRRGFERSENTLMFSPPAAILGSN
jgi:hypothetical protein